MSVTVRATPRPVEPSAGSVDLLAVPFLRRLLLSRYMPLAFQVLTLIALAWVIYDGFFGSQAIDENFATIGVWSIFFWPVILTSLLFLGRAWCGVCPMGALTAAAGRWSRGWTFPRRLSNTSLSLAGFVLILWILRPILGLSESPIFTAWFFLVWSAVAVGVGLLFPARAFCRYICPLSAPLSVLARVAPVALRGGTSGQISSSCAGCKGHECYNGSQTVQGCPMGEFPAVMDSNAHCSFCLKCLKSCSAESRSKGSPLQIRLRWPLVELAQVRKPSVLDSLTVVALAGIFLWHMAIGHEPRMPGFLHAWSQSAQTLVPSMQLADVEYLVTFTSALVGLGGLLALASFLTARLARVSFRRAFAFSGYPVAALVAFRASGYMIGDVITKAGDWLNYLGSLFGVYVYFPSAPISWAYRPLFAATSYHLWGMLVTIPLAIGLPVACLLSYKLWRRLQPSQRGALLASLPAMAAMLAIVVVYEWAYLSGFQVIR